MTAPTLDKNPHEFWNGVAGDRWVRFQEDLDRRISAFGDAGIEALAPRAGERVLDVGCGCGATSLSLAERVGPGGHVTGLDVSEPMLAHARRRGGALAQLGQLAHLEWALHDAATYRASAPFDALFSRFGVMFFPDPGAAFANLRAALRPGGRLGFVCWRGLGENLWAKLPLEAARTVSPPQPPSDPQAPGPFSFGDAARVRAILDGAGFTDARVQAFDYPMAFGDTLEESVRCAAEQGPAARLLEQLGEADRARGVVAIRAALGPHGPKVALPGAAWLVTATVS